MSTRNYRRFNGILKPSFTRHTKRTRTDMTDRKATTIRHNETVEEALRIITEYLSRQGVPLRMSTTNDGAAVTPLVEYALEQLARGMTQVEYAQWEAWSETYTEDVSQGRSRNLSTFSERAYENIERIGAYMETLPVPFKRLTKLMKGRAVYNHPLIITCALFYAADRAQDQA